MKRIALLLLLALAFWPGVSFAQTNPVDNTAFFVTTNNEYAPGTLAYYLSTNTVARTNGFPDTYNNSLELSHWYYASYVGWGMARLTNAIWSTNFWLAGVRGLGATCIGFSNGFGGQGLMTMVSPRHFLCATHMHPEAYLTAFLDTNNIIHWRKSLQRVDLENDLSVGILDADLPPSVGFLPIPPTNFPDYLPADFPGYVQGIGMNQDMRLFSEPMFLLRQNVTWMPTREIPKGLPPTWNVEIRGGDSSNPALMLMGDQLMLVSHNYYAHGGPDYALYTDAINQKMHYLSTNNAVGSDYQLTVFPLTNFPVIRR